MNKKTARGYPDAKTRPPRAARHRLAYLSARQQPQGIDRISDSDHQEDAKRPERPERPAPGLVVGVGASAGGLDPCKRLLESAPADKDIAFVVVLHLAPSQESHVAGILKTVTRIAVTQVTGKERIEPNHIYVIAPATSLGIRDGVLEVGEPAKPHYKARPIDAFFSALAADQRDRAVGIVLSGTGDDGAAGLMDIRSAGGLCLVQDLDTAEYDGMPRSAVDTGAADAIVPPGEMGLILLEYAGAPGIRPRLPKPSGRRTTEAPGEGLDAILALLGERYRVDFCDYKKNTLERRTQRRMGLKQISDWQDYLAYLRAHPEEVEALYSDVLIGVTRFLRDPEEWEFLEQQVVPELLASHDADTPVRVWSAGCATGEEAYSLAMIFLEHIERTGGRFKLQVFASDVSHEALAFARRGLYPARIETEVSPERLRRFFHRVGEHFQMDRDLRERVTFAAHDLLSDPPFAGLDLVSCRNVLIYLEPHAQERLLDLFHFSLRPHGVLWLGSAETTGGRSASFTELTGKHRMFRSDGRARPERYRVPHWVAERVPVHGLPPAPAGPLTAPQVARRLEQWVLQRYTSACVVIDRNLRILYCFGPTGEYLTQPVGEARMDLLSWARPGLYAKLRTGLGDAVEHGHEVTVTGMRRERDAESARVDATIEPITSVPGADGLFVVTFRDVPKPARLRVAPAEGGAPAEALVHQLEQELQEAHQELQSTVAQLVNVNEEHYASHEELLSLNEELQSSNEELETSKEELQSLNEELTITNRQLEERNAELRTVTSDLNNFLVSANVPTLFLDRQLRIRRFTPACTQVMRIVETDVGRSFEHVKAQVRDDNVLADVERVLESLTPIEAEVSTDDGRWFFRRVLPYRSEEERVDGVCVTFHDVTAQKRAADEIEDARLFAEAIIRTSRTPLLVLDAELRVVCANEAFYETFQVGTKDTEGHSVYELGNHQWDIPGLRRLLEALPAERAVRNYDVEHVFDTIGWRTMRINADLMKRTSRPDLILVSIEDVTDLRKAQMAAERRAQELAQDHRRKDEFLAMLGHELRNPLAALTNGLSLMSMASGHADAVERAREMMARQTRRMTTMLDQLLDVARVSSGKFELAQEAVDLVDAANAAIETVQTMLESARHELTVSFPPQGTALVLGDAGRLAQVVENLLGNAAKYTEAGGRIWLTVAKTDDAVKLSVRDTGVGLERDMLDHVFDLFTQAPRSLHRAKGGLGLGLPLVRSLVEMHRGHVDAFSAGLRQGSDFVVTLPRLRMGQAARPRDGEGGLPAVLSRRVLVVEDEDDAAQSLVDILAVHGHEARAARDGLAALDAARAFQPEVVLLDLGLPKLDGYEVARKLREEHGEQMFLVAVTGYPKDAARLHEAGLDDHLLKPPDLEKLFALIGAIDTRSRSVFGSPAKPLADGAKGA
jgi:two-component system CheB/CheR fusion protein